MSQEVPQKTESLEASEEISQIFRILARANQIASNTELDELLEQMLDLIASVCGTDTGTLYLLDRGTNELVFEVVHGGPESQNLVGMRISIDQGISGTAVREKIPDHP